MLNVSMELLMIMSYTLNNPRIRTQLKPLHDNGTVSLRLLQTHKSSYSSHGTRIKPPLLLLQKMIRICSAVTRLHYWTKKSWTSSGSIRSRGTASKTSVAPRTFSHRQDLSLHHTRRDKPFYVSSRTRTPAHWHRNQHGRRSCSAAGYSLEDLLSMLRRARTLPGSQTWPLLGR